MISNTSAVQLATQRGMLAEAYLRQTSEHTRRESFEFGSLAINYIFDSPSPQTIVDEPAELVFPSFDYLLPARLKSALAPDQQALGYRVEIDEGVALLWQVNTQPLVNGEEVSFDGILVVNVASRAPRAHFIATTLEALMLLDASAALRAPSLPSALNIHFADRLHKVGESLQRQQIAYRVMVIEKAFNQRFSMPLSVSEAARSNIDFVFRAVSDRTFAWPFWQDTFPFPANEQGLALLNKIDGTFPFLIEIGCLQENVLRQTLNLGPVNITVQNTALANPDEVRRELQQLDGHTFPVTIRSLSGAANYEFTAVPNLPAAPWDERTKQLIELEDKLSNCFFEAVNKLAAASLAGLTEEEIEAVTERPQLDEEAFLDFQ